MELPSLDPTDALMPCQRGRDQPTAEVGETVCAVHTASHSTPIFRNPCARDHGQPPGRAPGNSTRETFVWMMNAQSIAAHL